MKYDDASWHYKDDGAEALAELEGRRINGAQLLLGLVDEKLTDHELGRPRYIL